MLGTGSCLRSICGRHGGCPVRLRHNIGSPRLSTNSLLIAKDTVVCWDRLSFGEVVSRGQ